MNIFICTSSYIFKSLTDEVSEGKTLGLLDIPMSRKDWLGEHVSKLGLETLGFFHLSRYIFLEVTYVLLRPNAAIIRFY